MYEAYSVEEVACNMPVECVSITTDMRRDRLLYVQRDGSLVSSYFSTASTGKFSTATGMGKWEFELCRSFEPRKHVIALHYVESHSLLLCLVDNQLLNVHEASEPFNPVHSMAKYRPTSCYTFFTHKERGNLLRLALCSRRRVHLFKWLKDEFVEDGEAPSIYLSDNAQRLAWAGWNALVVGMKTEYLYVRVFVDEEEPEGYDIDDLGKLRSLLPTGTQRPSDHPPVIVELADTRQFGVCQDSAIHFFDSNGQPSSTFPHPCRYSDFPLAAVYDSPYLLALLPNSLIEIRSIHPAATPSMLIQKLSLAKSSFISPARGGSLFVASDRAAWALTSRLQLKNNVLLLAESKHYELAIHLVERSPSSVEAPLLLELKRRHALNLFVQKRFTDCFNAHLEVESDVLLVMNYFPMMIPEKYMSELSSYSPKLLVLFDPPVALTDADRRLALLSLGDYLSAKRTELAQVLSRHTRTLKDSGKKLLSTADYKRHEDVLRLVDSVLLKCYLETKPMLVPSLLRLADNSCIVSEAEADLSARQKWPELLILYERNKLHGKALKMLKKEWRTPANGHPTFSAENLAEYLQNLCFTGPSQAENQRLLFEFSPTVLEENLDLGVSIFTSERNSKDHARNLDHDEVLAYLKSAYAPAVIPYLEYLVNRLRVERMKFHEELVEQYVERIRVLMKEYTHTLNDDEVRNRAGDEEGELGDLRRRLMGFLEGSRMYDPEKVLTMLDEYLLEEKAIIYGKLKRHKEALAIYTSLLMDFPSAERHCAKHYSPETDPASSELFFLLFTAYASPNDFAAKNSSNGQVGLPVRRSLSVNVSEALKLLRKYSMEIDTVKALSMIPMETPLQRVWVGLQSVFQCIKNKATTTNLTLAVTKLAVKSVENRLYQLRSRRVKIDYSVECVLCKKRISDSAFVLYPTALAEKQGLSFKSQPDTSSVQRIAHLFCHTKANEQRRGMDSK